MPATTTTTELIAKDKFTMAQVEEQRDLRIKAGAIRSTIDQSDPVNYILTKALTAANKSGWTHRLCRRVGPLIAVGLALSSPL
jgi:hypothetical protein